jgi:hypothetical protein
LWEKQKCSRGSLAHDTFALIAIPRKNSTHNTLYAHATPVISTPANSAAPSLWREMDKFAPSQPYSNGRKKVLLNRHKMECRESIINGGDQRKSPVQTGL